MTQAYAFFISMNCFAILLCCCKWKCMKIGKALMVSSLLNVYCMLPYIIYIVWRCIVPKSFCIMVYETLATNQISIDYAISQRHVSHKRHFNVIKTYHLIQRDLKDFKQIPMKSQIGKGFYVRIEIKWSYSIYVLLDFEVLQCL